MKIVWECVIAGLTLAAHASFAQGGLELPTTVVAGNAFSVQTAGSGKATLYIVGLGQTLRRDVQLGETVHFPSGSLYNAGHYVVVLVRESSTPESGSIQVVPADKVAE